jgi:hypothetical protein
MFEINTAVTGFDDSNAIVDGGVEQPQDIVLFLFNVVLVKGQRFQILVDPGTSGDNGVSDVALEQHRRQMNGPDGRNVPAQLGNLFECQGIVAQPGHHLNARQTTIPRPALTNVFDVWCGTTVQTPTQGRIRLKRVVHFFLKNLRVHCRRAEWELRKVVAVVQQGCGHACSWGIILTSSWRKAKGVGAMRRKFFYKLKSTG